MCKTRRRKHARSPPARHQPRINRCENQERLKAEAKIEESLQTLDSLVADAALIQIELDIIRKNIEKSFEFLSTQQSQFPDLDSRLADQERQAAVRRFAIRREDMSRQLEHDKKSYLEYSKGLAHLRRKIVQRSRTLGIVPELIPSGTDWGRRLDQLEKKIDMIIDSLPAKLQP